MNNPRWERRKEARPAEIITAALDLFVEKGFAATRLDEVAVRAGVSKGTLYLYFPSKDALFKAVVSETIVPLLRHFEERLSLSQGSASEQLRMFFEEWWSEFGCTRMSGICKVVIAESGNFPEIALFFQQEVIELNHRLLAHIIEGGIRQGEFRSMDVNAACHLVMAPLVIQAIWQHSLGACQGVIDMPPEQLIRSHQDNMLRAFRADPPGTPAPRGTLP